MTAVDVSIRGAAVAVPMAGVAKAHRPASTWWPRALRVASVAAAVGLWQLLTASHVRLWLRFDSCRRSPRSSARFDSRGRHPCVLAGPRTA